MPKGGPLTFPTDDSPYPPASHEPSQSEHRIPKSWHRLELKMLSPISPEKAIPI